MNEPEKARPVGMQGDFIMLIRPAVEHLGPVKLIYDETIRRREES